MGYPGKHSDLIGMVLKSNYTKEQAWLIWSLGEAALEAAHDAGMFTDSENEDRAVAEAEARDERNADR